MSEDNLIEQSEIEAELRTDEPEGLLKKIFRSTGKGALVVGFGTGLVATDYSAVSGVVDYVLHSVPWAGLFYGAASLFYTCRK